MKRGHVNMVLLARGFTLLVAGTSFSGWGGRRPVATRFVRRDPTAPSRSRMSGSRCGGNKRRTRVTVARPYQTRPLRGSPRAAQNGSPGRPRTKAPTRSRRRRPLRTEPSSGARQRDAGASEELRRPFEHRRRAAPRHERRRRAEPLHAVDQPLLRDLQQAGVHGLRAGRRHDALPELIGLRNPERRRPGHPVRPVRKPLVRNAVGVRESRRRAVLPVRRGLADERPDGRLVLVPVPLAHEQVHGLCKVRRMAEPERLHDDLAAVLPRGQLLGHRRLGARAEPAPLVRQRADRVSRHGLAGS